MRGVLLDKKPNELLLPIFGGLGRPYKECSGDRNWFEEEEEEEEVGTACGRPRARGTGDGSEPRGADGADVIGGLSWASSEV